LYAGAQLLDRGDGLVLLLGGAEQGAQGGSGRGELAAKVGGLEEGGVDEVRDAEKAQGVACFFFGGGGMMDGSFLKEKREENEGE
jgi:hypothetical protein